MCGSPARLCLAKLRRGRVSVHLEPRHARSSLSCSPLGGRHAAVIPALPDASAEAEEVASVVAFLMSNESRWLNGQTLAADGGVTAATTWDALQAR